MRAVVTLAHGGRDQLSYTDSHADPAPSAGEGLLRTAACAVNYHDIFTRRGMPGIDWLKPARAGDLVAQGRVVKAGRRVSVADVDVHDAQGTLVAVGRGLYASPEVAT